MKNEKKKWVPPIVPGLMYPMNAIGIFGKDPLGTGPLGIDPMGSYTGVTEEPMEEPVQDADDL